MWLVIAKKTNYVEWSWMDSIQHENKLKYLGIHTYLFRTRNDARYFIDSKINGRCKYKAVKIAIPKGK